MTYTLTVGISLGAAYAGLTLSAQLKDTTGSDVGTAVATGFVDFDDGLYSWTYASFPDSFRGMAIFSSGGTNLAATAINPEEAENVTTILADTNDLQTRVPAALVGGRMDSSTGAMAANVLTATAIAADAITAAKVADGTIDAATFAAGAITAAAVATDAIDADALADNAITAATFAADAITAAKIADGAIDAATFAAGAITATVIATGAIDADALATDAVTEIQAAVAAGSVASVVGAVGSVTGNVGGNITGSVGSVAAGGITASSIAADAIGASELAADAASEIGTAVWATATRALTDKAGFSLSAAGIQAIWDALTAALTTASSIGKLLVDNINATVSSRASQTSLDTLDDLVDTEITDIRNRLPAALVSGRMDSSTGAMAAGVVTAAAIATDAIDADAIAANAIDASALAADAVTEIQAAVAAGAVASVTGAVGSVTGNVGGNVVGSVGSVAAGGITAISIAADAIGASELAADAIAEIQSGLATAAALATVDGIVDDILVDTAVIGAAGAGLTALATQASVNTIDDILDTEVPALTVSVAAIKAKTDLIPASPAAVGSAMTLDLTQALNTGSVGDTVGGALVGARAQAFGRWVLTGTSLVLYAADGTTVVRTFSLDSASAPTSRT